MATIRTRIALNDYKVVEKRRGLIIVRWDPVKEIVRIPKGRARRGQEPEYEEKESGYLAVTERVYREKPTFDQINAEVQADLNRRYPEGNKPSVDLSTIIALI